ncbi:transcription regulator HTH, apses-type DNA-binding domain-containing protein [Sporodiniella umbellata]|nr:transcription regulator HTH, apses-type DNA-binding domain-containing protein [Sporodiniella umbellata]
MNMNSSKPVSDFLPHQISLDNPSNALSAYSTNPYFESNSMNYSEVDSRTTFGNASYPRLPLATRPRLTTTLWKDEGTVCYQMDIRGICVARRQDNDMINGTKLLNVTGMSRGKRDGILKNEKGRVVIKAGAMHLKGVWITFDRAKALATQFNVDDVLYPLFVEDPIVFLYSSAHYPLNRPSQPNPWSVFQSPNGNDNSMVLPSTTSLSHLDYNNNKKIPENLYESFIANDKLSKPGKSSAFHSPYSIDPFSSPTHAQTPSNHRYHPYKPNTMSYKHEKSEAHKQPW